MRTLPPLLTVLLVAGCNHAPPASTPKLADLQAQVERQRRVSDQAVASYTPRVAGRIDDLSVPAADLLRQLPGVAEVEVLVAPAKRTHRIIHVCDWHFVAKDLYALDLGASTTPAELDAHYHEFLLQVELVQLEQEALLKCLAHHHGLRRVLYEGLTPPDLPLFRDQAIDLHKAGKETGGQLRQVRKLLLEMKKGTERYKEAVGVEKELLSLREEKRVDVLRMGAPGKLLGAGLIEVLPLDDAVLLEKAKPVTPDGTIRLDRNEGANPAHRAGRAGAAAGAGTPGTGTPCRRPRRGTARGRTPPPSGRGTACRPPSAGRPSRPSCRPCPRHG